MMWIFGSIWLDVCFLVLPAIISITFFFSDMLNPTNVGLIGLIVFTWIDSGHIYLTSMRTYFHRDELQSSNKYIWGPVLIFLTVFLWLYFGGAYIWSFVIYATLYHNLRQFYGISRWYQKNIGCKIRYRTQAIYVLTLWPVLLYHFRSDVPVGMYSQRDIILFPSQNFFWAGMAAYGLFLFLWLVYESYLVFKRKENVAVFLSLLVPGVSFAVGFLFGNNLLQVVGPIIVAHGIGYWALTALSVKRTRSQIYKNLGKALFIGLVLAVGLGSVESVIEDYFLTAYVYQQNYKLYVCMGLAGILTPLLAHYYIDAMIWSGKHREARVLFTSDRPRAGV